MIIASLVCISLSQVKEIPLASLAMANGVSISVPKGLPGLDRYQREKQDRLSFTFNGFQCRVQTQRTSKKIVLDDKYAGSLVSALQELTKTRC